MLLRIEITVLKVTVLGSKIYIFRSLKNQRRTRSTLKDKCKYTLTCCLYMITNYNILNIYSKMEQCYRGSFISKICHCFKGGEKYHFWCQRKVLPINAKGLDCWLNWHCWKHRSTQNHKVLFTQRNGKGSAK